MGAIDLNADLGETVDGMPTADDAAMFAVIVLSVVAVTDSAPVALTVVFVREAETPARPPRTGAWFRV